MLTVPAPAKLNLTLEVLSKRLDGFHEICSVMQTISLCDKLTCQSSQDVIIKSGLPGWKSEESLVFKAVSLIQRTTGGSRGVAIAVDKHIPLVSGLGGDSSDAAATLLGLNKLWELGLSQERLLDLAAQLGSDVPFFIHGGTALAEGRGELLTPLPPMPHHWAIVVLPAVPRLPGKTAQLYARLTPHHYTDGQITEKMVTALRAGREFPSRLLFNTFENIAFTRGSKLSTYRSHLIKMGAKDVHLAGSGPALFTLVKDKTEAEDLYKLCRQQNMEAYMVGTVGTFTTREHI